MLPVLLPILQKPQLRVLQNPHMSFGMQGRPRGLAVIGFVPAYLRN